MKFFYKDSARVNSAQLKKTISSLESYRKSLKQWIKRSDYAEYESSLHLGFDEQLLKDVLKLATKKRSKQLRFVVVIGIGGSNLGTRAIYDVLHDHPHILFLDTVSGHIFDEIAEILKGCTKKDEFVLLSITKSGETTETIANTEALLETIKKPHGACLDRLVVISLKGSHYWNAAIEKGIDVIDLPATVGGRYSIFTSVGLLPLALVGIDIKKLLNGARDATKDGVAKSHRQNHAIVSAALTYVNYKKGANIHNSFFFAPELEALGDWYRQLMAESLGKKRKGMTPIVSIGTTDMHSQAQLYFGGPRDKFTNIITAPNKSKASVPKKRLFPDVVEDIEGRSLPELMKAVSDGTARAYAKLKLPYVEIELEKADAHELGYYMQFRMIEMMYLAKLMGVNAFDQPMVETYKKETRDILKK